jgi:WD40 repeat protein
MGSVAELRSVGEVRGQLFGVRIIAFSLDGTQVVTGDVALELALWRDQRVVYRWDMTGEARWWRRGERIRAVAFSRDGRSLYVSCGESLWCLDCEGGTIKWEHRSRGIFAFMRNSCLATWVLPDGAVAATYDDGKFEVRSPDGDLVHRWGHRDCPRQAVPVGDGWTIVGADNHRVSVWDVRAGDEIATFDPGVSIHGLAASRDRSLVAIRTLEELILWDRVERSVIARVPGGLGLPCLDVCPQRDLVAAADLDGVRVFNSRAELLARADARGMRVLSAKFMPEGSTLVAGCMDGTIRAWDVGALLRTA